MDRCIDPNMPHAQPTTPQPNRYIVAPLMAGYALYSLVHERHKGWYSWAVTSLTGFVYVFGFVMMTPQVRGHVGCCCYSVSSRSVSQPAR